MEERFFKVTLLGLHTEVFVNRNNITFFGRGPHDSSSMRIYFNGGVPVCLDVEESREELLLALGLHEAEQIGG